MCSTNGLLCLWWWSGSLYWLTWGHCHCYPIPCLRCSYALKCWRVASGWLADRTRVRSLLTASPPPSSRSGWRQQEARGVGRSLQDRPWGQTPQGGGLQLCRDQGEEYRGVDVSVKVLRLDAAMPWWRSFGYLDCRKCIGWFYALITRLVRHCMCINRCLQEFRFKCLNSRFLPLLGHLDIIHIPL